MLHLSALCLDQAEMNHLTLLVNAKTQKKKSKNSPDSALVLSLCLSFLVSLLIC